jgi:hypothetical protein
MAWSRDGTAPLAFAGHSPWPVPIFGTEIQLANIAIPGRRRSPFSPVDKTSLYLGTQYVLKTTDGGLHWAQISPDLTGSKAPPALQGVVAPSGNPSAGIQLTMPLPAGRTLA